MLRRYAAGERDFAGIKMPGARLTDINDADLSYMNLSGTCGFYIDKCKRTIFKDNIMPDSNIRSS